MISVEGPLIGQSAACAPILRALPEWFGLEKATRHYIDQTDVLPTFVARIDAQPVGFLTLKQHGPSAAEVYVMGVDPARQRQGVGRALLEAAEAYLRDEGIAFLQVKTLSPAHPDAHYAKTRAFYAAMGFEKLEEFPELWDADNPCLQLIKHLPPRRSRL